MKVERLKQARRLFAHPDVPRSTVRHNIRAWVRAVRLLGSNWVALSMNGGLQ